MAGGPMVAGVARTRNTPRSARPTAGSPAPLKLPAARAFVLHLPCPRRLALRLAAEAGAWMRCERRDWPFSFVNICEVLGFDAATVRTRLLSAEAAAIGRRQRRSVHTLIRSRTTPRCDGARAASGPTLRIA